MTPPFDRALLESALNAIEQVLAHHDGAAASAPSSTPAQEAMSICLGSAAALVDVANTLLRRQHSDSSDQLAHEWQVLIAHTKMAGRTAHQAALILASQRNIVAAQQGVTLKGDGGASPAVA